MGLRNGDGGIDWSKTGNLFWAIVVGAILATWTISGRTETPQQKEERIIRIVTAAITVHEHAPGHAVMVERVSRIEREMRLQETLDLMSRTLIEIRDELQGR